VLVAGFVRLHPRLCARAATEQLLLPPPPLWHDWVGGTLCLVVTPGAASSLLSQDLVVKKYHIPPVDEKLLDTGLWHYLFPVRIKGLCTRAFVFGLYFMVVVSVPVIIILALILKGNDTAFEPKGYCVFKACFAAFVDALVFPSTFVSAISTDKFVGTPFHSAMATPSGDGPNEELSHRPLIRRGVEDDVLRVQ
jgi:hypothetical protein